jgi:hypothetical protein
MTAKEHALLDLLERTLPYLETLHYQTPEGPAALSTLIDTIRAATVLAVMEE